MNPLVSVLIVTYNQSAYIEKCLSSIVEQSCDFNIEIVLCDDCSTDDTFERCKAIAKLHPNILAHRQETNVGVNRNLAFGLEQCKGKHIAFCDGDDYWTDPEKLQKMIKILEDTPDCSLIYSDYGKIDSNGQILADKTLDEQPEKFGLPELVDQHGPAVNSMILRKSVIPNQFSSAFYRVLNPDVFLLAWALNAGYGHFINSTMSMYRVHEGGIWSGLEQNEKNLLQLSTRIIVFGSLGPAYRAYRDTCVEKLDELLWNLKGKGHKDLYDQYKRMLPIKNRMKFNAKSLYSKLISRD